MKNDLHAGNEYSKHDWTPLLNVGLMEVWLSSFFFRLFTQEVKVNELQTQLFLYPQGHWNTSSYENMTSTYASYYLKSKRHVYHQNS